MAKLSARGRREWVRVRKGPETMTYLSDGVVLLRGPDKKWRIHSTWDVTRSVKILRGELVAAGWSVCETAEERDWRRVKAAPPRPVKRVSRGCL